jgi:predicted flavoprotein YhiN
LYDSMPSLGRKFLMAGKGGLNLTHSEATQNFLARYGARRRNIEPLLSRFGPDALRDGIAARGTAIMYLHLLPGRDFERVIQQGVRSCSVRSLLTHLQSRLGVKGVKAGLLREALPKDAVTDPARIAAARKALPLKLVATRPLDEAISTACGIAFEALDANMTIRRLPGIFCAGDMLEWEAATGGYLLTAWFASGRAAGAGALAWLDGPRPRDANLPPGPTESRPTDATPRPANQLASVGRSRQEHLRPYSVLCGNDHELLR